MVFTLHALPPGPTLRATSRRTRAPASTRPSPCPRSRTLACTPSRCGWTLASAGDPHARSTHGLGQRPAIVCCLVRCHLCPARRLPLLRRPLPPQYYSLDITFFKSSLDSALLDLLWNSYWVNTLSASPLVGARPRSTLQCVPCQMCCRHCGCGCGRCCDLCVADLCAPSPW